MQTILYTLTTFATVAGLIAGFLASFNHKKPAVWVLFASLLLFALTLCLYLQDKIGDSEPAIPNQTTPTQNAPTQDEAQPQKVVPPQNSVPPTTTPTPAPPPATEQPRKVSQVTDQDDYEPDEMDKIILQYLAQGIDPYLPSITKHLHEKGGVKLTSEVEYRLARLVEYKYIRRIKPKVFSPVPLDEYKLDRKGGDFLFSSAAAHSPQKPKETEPPKSRDEYKPDKIAVEILKHIYRSEWPDPIEDLPKELGVDRLEIETRLDELIEHSYVEVNEFAPLRGNSPYTLTPKGRQYLLTTPARTIPFPDSEPSESEKRILILLAYPDSDPCESRIAKFLYVSPIRLQHDLKNLIGRGFIEINGSNKAGAALYQLTDRGKQFLIVRNMV
jgi:hypothetical protein